MLHVTGLLLAVGLLGLLGLPLQGQADSIILALPQDGPTSVTAEEVGATAQGVRVQVTERPLREVLQRIQNESGIQIEISTAIMTVHVTASLEAPDWATALRQLLERFGRAEVRDEANRLRRVLVVGAGEGLPPVGVPVGPVGPPASGTAPGDPGTAKAPPGVTPPPEPYPGPPVGEELPFGTGPPDEGTQPYYEGPEASPYDEGGPAGPPVGEELPFGTGPPDEGTQPYHAGPKANPHNGDGPEK